MSHGYGDIISVPITIKENEHDKQIHIYNPVQETPQFLSLLQIIKKWVIDKFDIHDVIPVISKIMAIVNQAVSSPHSGEYKKKLVLSLLYCCVKTSDLLIADKHLAYSVISNVAPSAIDTMVSIARGDIDIKKTVKYVEKNCLSIFQPQSVKNDNELSNTIYEHHAQLSHH